MGKAGFAVVSGKAGLSIVEMATDEKGNVPTHHTDGAKRIGWHPLKGVAERFLAVQNARDAKAAARRTSK